MDPANWLLRVASIDSWGSWASSNAIAAIVMDVVLVLKGGIMCYVTHGGTRLPLYSQLLFNCRRPFSPTPLEFMTWTDGLATGVEAGSGRGASVLCVLDFGLCLLYVWTCPLKAQAGRRQGAGGEACFSARLINSNCSDIHIHLARVHTGRVPNTKETRFQPQVQQSNISPSPWPIERSRASRQLSQIYIRAEFVNPSKHR